MPENTYRESPFVSPDSMRQKLHFDKALFEMHTKKQFGREDINGSQYVGTVENFGSEMLLESRKMRMMKPALNHIWRNHNVDYWFKMEYADELPTYDQWNMFTLVLKEDVVCDGYRTSEFRYPKLVFKNAHMTRVLRSECDSNIKNDDGEIVPFPVLKTWFIETTTPPVLKYDNTEYQLKVRDPHDGVVKYSWYIDDDFDQSISLDDIEIQMDETFVGMPCVWIWLESYNTLPKLTMEHNVDAQGLPLLIYGTNNIGNTFLYPLTYFDSVISDEGYTHFNLPLNDWDPIYKWQIRVHARDHLFNYEGVDLETNMNTDIEEIQYVLYPGNFIEEPGYIHTIRIPKNDHIHVTLNPDLHWSFRKPHQGEWGYDGLRYQNFIYGYLNDITTVFNDNMSHNDNVPMIPLLRVHFDDNYYNEYTALIENAISGIHVDYTSDYSDNGVIKKHGVTYNLNDFDGLPEYYYRTLDENIKHPRVTLYSIRDYVDKRNQSVNDKHISALIVDGAIQNFNENQHKSWLDSIIKYSYNVQDPPRTYRAIDTTVLPVNVLSDMAYIPIGSDLYREVCQRYGFPEGTLVIADATIPEFADLEDRFLYQGNLTFSTNETEFDAYTEIARVYYVNNDPSEYENNLTSDYPKPERTLARICDIPTEFGQLVHIEGYSPTFVCDEQYVHSECEYTINDQERIQELNTDIHYMIGHTSGGMFNQLQYPNFIFESEDELNGSLNSRTIPDTYRRSTNLVTYLDMPDIDTLTITAASTTVGANGYTFYIARDEQYTDCKVGDKLSTLIGGIMIDFKVTSITNGVLTLTGYNNGTDLRIPFANLEERISTYRMTGTTSRVTNNPILITLKISEEKWIEMSPDKQFMSNLFAIVRDKVGNLIEYKYIDSTWVKGIVLSGEDVVYNPYDIRYLLVDGAYSIFYDRDINNTFFYDVLSIMPATSNDYTYDKLLYESSIRIGDTTYIDSDLQNKYYEIILDPLDESDFYYEDYEDFVKASLATTRVIEVSSTAEYYEHELDLSQDIVNQNVNFVNGYYLMHRIDDTHRRMVPLALMTNKMTYDPQLFPQYHRAVVSHYQPTTNQFTRLDEELFTYPQPELILYNPYKTCYTDYIQIACDIYAIEEIPITYMDLKLSPAQSGSHTVDDMCKRMNVVSRTDGSYYALKENVYKFDFYKLPSSQTNIHGLLQHGTVSALLSYIKIMISRTALPVLYANTEYAYDREMLVDYILENLPGKYPYNQNIHENSVYTSKIGSAGDVVIADSSSNRYIPTTHETTTSEVVRVLLKTQPDDWPVNYYMDKYCNEPVSRYTPGYYYKYITKTEQTPVEQPTGEYYSVTRKVFYDKHHIGNNKYQSNPLFLLKVNDDFRLFDHFHMIDDVTGNDISKYTLLVHDKIFYMFDESQDTWKPISRK